jgi:hypothetical protein
MIFMKIVMARPILTIAHHASPPNEITRALNYLDAHSGSLQVLTSIVLIVVTAAYTVLTKSMARASQEALQPYVYLDLAFDSPAEMIVIVGNSGNKVAGHVTATLEASNNEKVAKLVRDLPITSGIGHLAPGGKLRYSVLINGSELLPSAGPAASFTFKIKYHDGKRTVSDKQVIDLEAYRSALVFERPETSEVVHALREISRKMPSKSILILDPTKPCPYCGTKLIESATKCHGCQEWLRRPRNGIRIEGARRHQIRRRHS